MIAMAVTALLEIRRKNVAEKLRVTFLWIALQYLFLGSADLLTLAGMMELFFTEAHRA